MYAQGVRVHCTAAAGRLVGSFGSERDTGHTKAPIENESDVTEI